MNEKLLTGMLSINTKGCCCELYGTVMCYTAVIPLKFLKSILEGNLIDLVAPSSLQVVEPDVKQDQLVATLRRRDKVCIR